MVTNATAPRNASTQYSGFTYIGLLILIAVLGIGLAVTGVVFHQQAQRAKERELLFAGDQIRHAIAQYHEKSPAGSKRFPETLEDLVLDERYATTRRYLRRVYQDPMLGSKAWELVRAPEGGIIGVHSGSRKKPLKIDNFPAGYDEFKAATSYIDWKFVFEVPAEVPATPGTAPLAPTPGGPPASR